MSNLMEWLKGKKSYILLFVAFIFNLGVLSGWWATDNATWSAIDLLIASLLGASFRAAITKSSPNP